MLFKLKKEEFSAISRKKTQQSDEHATACWRVLGALTACWMRELGSQKLSIMFFVVNRTLYYRKEAEQIWQNQWQDGIVDSDGNPICDGIAMAKSTFRAHLKELIENDFLHAYACIEESGAENVAKLYEINFTKVLKPYVTEGSEMGLLPTPKRFKTGSKRESGSTENWEGGVPESGTLNNIIKRLGKPNLSAGVPRSGKVVAGTDDIVADHPHLREPKQKRRGRGDESPAYEDPPEPTGRALVQMIQNRDRTAKAERLKKAATREPWELSKLDLQALLDKAMKLYHPNEPRMLVTAKEHGMLRKRLKESAPKDFSDFIDWTIRSWYTLAVQNRRALMKDTERLAKNPRLMGECPNFHDLAYRYPYFLKCHSNHVVGKRGVEQEQERDKKRIAVLEQQVRDAQQQATAAQRQVKVMRRRPPVAVSQERAPHPDTVPERRGVRVVDDEIDFTSRFRPEDEPAFPTDFIDGSPEQHGARRLRNGK